MMAVVDVEAPDALGLRVDDHAARDDRDVGRPAADVHDGRRVLILDGDARADGRRQPLLDHVDAADVRRLGGGAERALLDLRDAGEHAHHGAAAEVRDAAARAPDELVEHALRPLEVGDDAVHQRVDERDVARLAPVHLVRLAPDGDDLARRSC